MGRFESPVPRLMAERFALGPQFASPAFAAPAEMASVSGLMNLDATLGNLGDYKLYSLPAPTTLAARQSKQIRFLALDNVRYERLYRFDVDDGWLRGPATPSWQRPVVLIRAQNREVDGLGKPLPAGSLSVMEQHGDAIVLAGQDRLQDTPVDLPLELQIATAMDVWIEPRIIEDRTEQVSTGHRERQVQLELRILNDKAVPIVLEIRQPVVGRRDFRVVDESHPHSREDGDAQWTFQLAAGERAALRYSFRHAH
jgi:hypothetical protein